MIKKIVVVEMKAKKIKIVYKIFNIQTIINKSMTRRTIRTNQLSTLLMLKLI